MTKAVMRRRLGGGKIPSFVQLRAMFQESREEMKESREEMKESRKELKEIREQMKETDRQMKDTDRKIQETGEQLKKTERVVEETGEQLRKTELAVERTEKIVGGLGCNFGALAENMVGNAIAKKFNELEYHFNLVANKGCEIPDENGKTLTEVDILLENGETVIAVEVKTKPVLKDIEHHIKQMKIVREKWMSIKKENKRVLGAIAGAIYSKEMKEAVSDAGLFVIEQSGDTMKIDMPEGCGLYPIRFTPLSEFI